MSIIIQNLQAFSKVASEAYWEAENHTFNFKDSNDQEYTFTLLKADKVYLDEEEAEKGYYRELTLLCNNKKYSFSYMDDYEIEYIDNLQEIKQAKWQEAFDEFKTYLEANPEQRFWQALRNCVGANYINYDGQDTFHWNTLNDNKK